MIEKLKTVSLYNLFFHFPSNSLQLSEVSIIYVYMYTVVAKIIRKLVFSPAKKWF